MAYYENSQKKYRKKTIQFKVQYSLQEIEEGKALKEYLETTGQSANAYIKNLIKIDLIKKGIL